MTRNLRPLLLLLILLGAAAAFGQQHPDIKRGFTVDNAYQLGELDHVNNFNGNLIVQIPIGPRFQVGGSLSYALSLTYNSKVFEFEADDHNGPGGKPGMKVIPNQRSNAGLGWFLSLGRILDVDHDANHTGGIVYESPDGGEHRIYCTLHDDEEDPWGAIDEDSGQLVPCKDLPLPIRANDPGQTQGYTRDGTYLRMRWESEQRVLIEFPDGTQHVFADDPIVQNKSMRIVEMRDRFGNKVTIDYPDANTCKTRLADGVDSTVCWKITDSSSTGSQKRTHWVRFEPVASETTYPNYKSRVGRVDVAQWNSSTTANYDFGYDVQTTNRPRTGCFSSDYEIQSLNGEPRVSRLRTITLPTKDKYEFDYYQSSLYCAEGGMRFLTLPTGGLIAYEYKKYQMPNNSCRNETVMSVTPGISRRTVWDKARGNVNDETDVWIYDTGDGITKERACEATTSYPFSVDFSPELINTVRMPTGEVVTHYFSVWPKINNTKDPIASKQFRRHEYGLPFTRAQSVKDDKGNEFFLSSTTTDTNSTTIKFRTYVMYEMDPKSREEPYEPTRWDRNRRVKGVRTEYVDGKFTQTLYDDGDTDKTNDFDGLGHFRTTVTNGNFAGSNVRTTFTGFNPGKKMPPGNTALDPPTIPHNATWLLETYDKRTVKEGSTTLAMQYCFNSSTAFLEGLRTLKSKDGTTTSTADLLTRYEHVGGNVTAEKYYGGDKVTTSASGCQPGSESPGYQIKHTYDFGVLKTSEHVGSGFFSVNNVIDPYTGLVNESRDSAGIATTFTYDALSRIKTVTPQSGNGASFNYEYKLREGSPTIDITATGAAGQVDRKFVRFDSLGRIWRTFDQMPGTDQPTSKTWSVRQIVYDGQGRQSEVYQAAKVIADDPALSTPALTDKTTYQYDYLGRPTIVHPPDSKNGVNHDVEYNYHNGIAQITETTRRAGLNGAERPTTIKRTYDRFGRLQQVDEPASGTSVNALTGGNVVTTYTYDPADRLLTVDNASQDRRFNYDGRGFLDSESHPESGLSDYSDYDARGHAGKRVNGGNTLTFTYDSAERLEKITDQNNRELKVFVFGKENDGRARGKLLKAVRRNDIAEVGRVDVTETYTYDGAGGQMSNRKTLVERVNGSTHEKIQEFDYGVSAYDDLLLPKQISMPTCSGCPLPEGTVATVTNERTAGHLTSVKGFGALTYHPSGMVETVVHETTTHPTDRYSVQNGIPRPSRITFTACGAAAPRFLPGDPVAKTNPLECGLQIEWPVATACGSGSGIQYRILRENKDIATSTKTYTCVDTPKYVDKTAEKGVAHTYRVIAEGPAVPGGKGLCQGGLEFELPETITGTKGGCSLDVTLDVAPVWTSFVGIPQTYKAFLKTPDGPVVGEELMFLLNGKKLNCVDASDSECSTKTGADGSATATGSLDLQPKEYELKVIYPGGVLPRREVTATVNLFCGFASYLVNPLIYTLPPAAHNYPVFVGTSQYCSWTPLAAPDFITLPVPGKRTGSGQFDFNVSQNGGTEPRSSQIAVAFKQVKVKQNGSGCSYSFNPEIVYVDAFNRGQVTVDVSTGPDCPWHVEASPSDWITFQSPPIRNQDETPRPATKDTGSRKIYFTVEDQEAPNKRVATLNLYDKEQGGVRKTFISVNQDAPPIPIAPSGMDVNLHGGSVSNGSNVTLRVWLREGTQLKYEWYINDIPQPVCKNCDSRTFHPGESEYPSNQSVTYQVKVFNDRGTVWSNRVSWSNSTPNPTCHVPYLLEGPFRPADAPLDSTSPFPGYNVSLFVYALGGVVNGPPLTYEWFRGLSGDETSAIPPDPPDANGISHPDEIHVNPFHTSFYWVKVTQEGCGSNKSRTVAVFSAPPPPPGRRRACCTFDANKDNHNDIPWHNSVTGQNEIWLMNGTTHSSTAALPSTDPKTQLQSGGDLNADGNLDLMFRNPETGRNDVWLMNGTNVRDFVQIESRPGKDWTIGAISDFDLDDHDDIVWHNGATGANEIWFGEDTDHLGTWALPNSGSAGLYGRGDFNGDEKPDLFLHNRTTGENQIWVMNNAQRLTVNSADSPLSRSRTMSVSTMTIQSSDPDLVPALVADMDGDGRADIVWRNPVTGDNSVWIMDPSSVGQVKETHSIETRSDPAWNIGGGGNSNNPETGGGNPNGGGTGDTPTSIDLTVDTVSVGKPAIATATLKSGTTPIADREVVFSLSGTEVTRLLTDTDGSVTAVIDTTGRTAGTYGGALSARFNGDSLYAGSSKSADLVITSETPQVTWNEPAAITYGTPLSATQLNATATAPGTFVYTPAAGAILNAGYQTLRVKFTPSDASLAAITVETVVMVNKAPSTIAWAAPAPISYGTPLSAAQLNATSPLRGSFTYVPGPGAIVGLGTQTLRVTFEPDDPNFEVSTAATNIEVGKGRQLIFWDDPAPITVLQPLSAAQLNAIILPSGTAPAGQVTYTPALGTLLSTGTHELQVSVAATAEYDGASASVDIVVLQVQSHVQWATPAPIVYGTPLPAAVFNATADVPGTFAYSHEPGVILNAGSEQLTVTFTPSDSRYDPSSATVTIEIAKANPTISWNRPAAIVYGTPLSYTQFNAQVSVVGPAPASGVRYTPGPGTILNAGLGQTLTVDVDSTENYNAATFSVTIDVLKAAQSITWASPAPIVYGTPLSATQLNASVSVVGPAPAGALTYTPPAGTVMQAGNAQTLTVTAAETANYQPATQSVTIDVLKQKPVLAWAQPAPIIYRTLLGASQLNATSNVPGSFVYAPPAGTVLEAGNQPLSAHFTPSDTRNYEEGDVTTTLEVRQATPIITWPQPAGIVYGTSLGAAQLNATADVPGAFTYDPAAGTILNAGPAQRLSVHFKPADTRNFKEVDASTTLDVAKAKQTLSWTPPSIVYGTALSSTQLNAKVTVVGPAAAGALVYTPPAGTVLDAGQHTLRVDAQETSNYEAATLTATITVNRAPLSLVVDAKSKLYGSAVPALTGTLTGVVNHDPITASYATTATLQSVAGQYPITGSLVDPNHRLPNYDVTITNATLTVLPAPLTISADPKSKQYSDPIPPFTATYIGLVLGETPAVLSGTLVMQTTASMLSAPGPYPITIGGLTSPNYAITYVNSTLTVLPEDARVIVTSPLFVTVAASGPTSVTLSATIRDISATPDAAGDVDPGDIRKATLTFVDRATGSTLCSPAIGLLSANEQLGIATCTFTRNFGSTLPATLTIGTKIGAYYTRDAAADDVILTVSKPTPDQIAGAAKVILTSVAGSHAPDAGSEGQFNVVFMYDNDGTVKHNFTFKFTRTESGAVHQYELTPASVASLAINRHDVGATAMVIGTGTLVDTTTRQTVATNVPLFLTATDSGDTKTPDSIALTLLKSDGGLWLATGWNGLQAVELPISNGQLVIVEKK